ncbi:F-box protein [Vitis vinifera]|uniref:F-box protein n=1 Tax=Vitis vinifera TaxID=29760 RepID=A0A438E6P3_VITVI|nr:F-box protein [Vitis vinifera]
MIGSLKSPRKIKDDAASTGGLRWSYIPVRNVNEETSATPSYSGRKMKQRTWPVKSEGSRFTALRLYSGSGKKEETRLRSKRYSSITIPFRSSREETDFSKLPDDILQKIAATFTLPDLQTASLVCRSWRDSLRPLREAMLLLKWGKRFKHGHGGVRPNIQKALDSFLKGAARGSTLAMVDAGLIYWEMGKKEESVALYRKAAELGDPTAQCNLGISYLHSEPPKREEAAKWLYLSSNAGYVRAQYQLALCLHRGRGMDRNLPEAVCSFSLVH